MRQDYVEIMTFFKFLTSFERIKLMDGVIEKFVGTTDRCELFADYAVEGWTQQSIVQRSLGHTSDHEINIVWVGIDFFQFLYRLLVELIIIEQVWLRIFHKTHL